MGVIRLEPSGDGTLRRLIALCENDQDIAACEVCPGATQRTDKTVFGLPADHTLVFQLMHISKNTIMPSPETQAWVDSEVAKVRSFASSILRDDCEGDPRLYPYQRVDVDIMKRNPFVINHNPMGSGKTIEWLMATQGAPSALAVVPKGLMGQWAEKAEDWLGEEVTILHGNATQKKKLWDNRRRIVVTTYNTTFTFDPVMKHRWGAIGWDEGHRLTGRNTKRSEAAFLMRADHRSILTATMMRKHPGYFYFPLHIAYPHAFTSYYSFINRFCEMEHSPWGDRPIGLLPSVKKMFQYILSGVMIQRDKEVILPFLPEKRVDYVHLDMTPSQAKAYKEMKKELETVLYATGRDDEAIEVVARTNGSKFTKLRRLSLDPGMYTGEPDSNKTEYILDYCEDADDKVVVFSWYKDYVDLLHKALLDRGINAVKMHGGQSDKENALSDSRFKKDPNVQVIVGTIAKMAEGFDYPMATTVLFADVSYIPDDNRQGEERIWRPGQTKTCRIIYLITKKTVDEIVHKVVQQRANIIDETMAYKAILEHLAREGD